MGKKSASKKDSAAKKSAPAQTEKIVAGDSLETIPQEHSWFARLLLGRKAKPVPTERTNELEHITFWDYFFLGFILKWLRIGYDRVLMLNDNPLCPKEFRIEQYYDQFKKWMADHEDKKDDPYIEFIGICWVTKWLLTSVVASGFAKGAMQIAVTVLTNKLINQSDLVFNHGAGVGPSVGYVIGIIALQVCNTILTEQQIAVSRFYAERARQILVLEMNQKLHRISQQARLDFTMGKLVSIVVSDQRRFVTAGLYVEEVLVVPATMLGNLGILIWLLGPIGLAGFGLVLIAMGLSLYSTKWIAKMREYANPHQDARIGVTREAIKNMEIIKVFGWEMPFAKRIQNARSKELIWVRLTEYTNAFLTELVSVIPGLAGVMTFGIRVHMEAGKFSPANAFPSLSAFQSFTQQLDKVTTAVLTVANAWVAVKRMNSLMRVPDMVSPAEIVPNMPDNDVLTLQNCSFGWISESDAQSLHSTSSTSSAPQIYSEKGPQAEVKPADSPVHKHIVLLDNVTLSIKRGSVNVVMGTVGSGKTTLLEGIAEEATLFTGKIKQDSSVVKYNVFSYWSSSGSIRDNILFGKEYDRDLYRKVIKLCDLQSDFSQFTNSDLSEIGENGITLSGGQRARLALARCLYADGNFILLDDVLSAMDAKVGAYIYKELVKLAKVEGKTIVMSTNDSASVRKADTLIFVKDGTCHQVDPNDLGKYMNVTNGDSDEDEEEKQQIVENKDQEICETAEETSELGKELLHKEMAGEASSRFAEPQSALAPERSLAAPSFVSLDPENYVNQSAFETEKKHIGGVAGIIFVDFLKIYTPWAILLASTVLVSGAATGAASSLLQVFLNWWTSKKDPSQEHWGYFNQPQGWYVGFYCLIVCGEAIAGLILYCTAVYYVTGAATMLFSECLHGIMTAPMSFFHRNPLGRILSRFSDNLTTLDSSLALAFRGFYLQVVYVLASAITMFYYVPWAALALIPVIIVVLIMLSFFRCGGRDLNRLLILRVSRFYDEMNEGIEGCQVITALKRGAHMSHRLKTTSNDVVGALTVQQGAYNWASLYSALSADFVTLVVLLLGVVDIFDYGYGVVGILVNLMPQLSSNITYLAIQLTWLESLMNNVERLNEYAHDIENEYESPSEDPNLITWEPTAGKIEFSHVSMRYQPQLPLVLNDISFSIDGGKRLGIVGRTGAGKSTIINTLFRLTPIASGSIEIDGVRTDKVPLKRMRQGLTIIPQMPVLFDGTIRSNLDPANEKSDQELWEALDKSLGLSDRNAVKFHLDAKVEADGANFSMGERQLLALTRALVRRAKILILDEATANVDEETDRRIQQTIRKGFKGCTVITIAHRIKTIINYDEIMVMGSGGFLLEKGPPQELIAKGGTFASLVQESQAQGHM